MNVYYLCPECGGDTKLIEITEDNPPMALLECIGHCIDDEIGNPCFKVALTELIGYNTD